ncbi:restriction endonuclease subunit S [Marinicrinis lubricantis]|uniref:Restriction endonuclease subunit S n=1 Tax=Marinicrinis lubricantis TaxID=2086470 RepID=A0ABW1IPT9_9BACL
MRTKKIKLKEIASISAGSTAPDDKYFGDQGYPFIRVSHLDDLISGIDINTIPKVSEKHAEVFKLKKVRKGTLLLAKSGMSCLKNRVYQCTTDSFVVNHLATIDVKNELADPSYICYFLRWFNVSKLIVDEAYPSIRTSAISEIEVSLPDMKEQRTIITLLDKAQNLIDKRKKAIAKLDELVQAVFLDMFGDPVTNSKNLDTISLGELGEWKSGGTPSRGSKEYFKGNIPWYTSGELNDLYVNDSIEYITETALKETSTKEVPIGALLLGMYDTAALKSSITQKRSSCNQAIAFAKIDENLAETKYVYYAIQMGKEHYKRVQRGVRQKNLNLSMIKAIEILYPSLELQKDFVRIADIIYLNKQQMNVQLQQLESNFQALLQKAFKGELIVKDGVTV